MVVFESKFKTTGTTVGMVVPENVKPAYLAIGMGVATSGVAGKIEDQLR